MNFIQVLKPRIDDASLGEHGDYRGWRPDPILNRAHIPGLRFVYVSQDKKEFSNFVEYNSKGLNDSEYSYEKEPGTKRILVLGDSFAEALQVKRENNFCEILEKKLNESGKDKRYDVINMGVSGYSPILEYLYLKNEGLKYGPDFVILFFFMNDVYEDSVYKGMAIHDKNSLPLSVYWQGFNKKTILKGPKKIEREISGFVKRQLNKSRFYRFLKERFYNLLTATGIKKAEPAANPFFILTKESRPDESGLWLDTFRYIQAMKKISEDSGAGFLLVTIPIESQFSDEPDDAAFHAYFTEKPDSERSSKKIEEFCGKYDIDCIDLLSEFKNHDVKDLYFKNDGHFNENGHRVVAGILLEKMENAYE